MTSPPLLSVHLSVRYSEKQQVLRGVQFDIEPGEVLGLVGQSGSGKSTLALSILGLLNLKSAKAEGRIQFQGIDLLRIREKERRAVRGRSIGLISQSPLSSLNPALRIRTQLQEAWRAHVQGTQCDCNNAIQQALSSVSLPHDAEFLLRRPAQLSVGQAQRILIAMAVMHRPALLIADEATSALDVITQSEILALLARLNQENGVSILYISHDLPSVAAICRRVAILHGGTIVECASIDHIFRNPQHPYTRRLMAALPAIPERVQLTAKAVVSGIR
jgi:ABC-type glutathione transport system ATPase component